MRTKSLRRDVRENVFTQRMVAIWNTLFEKQRLDT